jgi:hypothetical protein
MYVLLAAVPPQGPGGAEGTVRPGGPPARCVALCSASVGVDSAGFEVRLKAVDTELASEA